MPSSSSPLSPSSIPSCPTCASSPLLPLPDPDCHVHRSDFAMEEEDAAAQANDAQVGRGQDSDHF
eukprot:761979-Hanusia_phi.AAC.1